MTINTAAVAAHIAPTVVARFFQHYYKQAKKNKEDRGTEATDEFLFDQAFHIVKRFIGIGTHDTVESLQAFTNTHVPSPPWATVVAATVPLSSCDQAASLLLDFFGEDELKEVVGGSRWWQVRGLQGLQAEWIAQASDWKKVQRSETEEGTAKLLREVMRDKIDRRHKRAEADKATKARASAKAAKVKAKEKARKAVGAENEEDAEEWEDDQPAFAMPATDAEEAEALEELDRLKRVMLYTNGGGYYFGSINTHRYQIIRLARKFGGRAFSVNYRKCPQYPFPCAVQDVLAAYLYLIRPPPDAPHKAIQPSRIVVAGDSAGGGLTLALLTVLRDLELPMPAGAVLISPWCDMTHSFPSILQNTATDIIPEHGFIHKPSTLWPIPAIPKEDNEQTSGKTEAANSYQEKEKDSDGDAKPEMEAQQGVSSSKGKAENPAVDAGSKGEDKTRSSVPEHLKRMSAKSIRVPVTQPHEDAQDGYVDLRAQIQLYATNDQLTHRLCSPILAGSLGGLPPLYIIGGESEVLRDEITYLAHRAAKPSKYPLPPHLAEKSERTAKDAKRFDGTPTKVHLQIFDDQPHVMTLFAFTTQARFAYRAIASFVKHVTGAPTNIVDPFPGAPSNEEMKEDDEKIGPGGSYPVEHSTSNVSGVSSSEIAADGVGVAPGSGNNAKERPTVDTWRTGAVDGSDVVDSPSALTPATPSKTSGSSTPTTSTSAPGSLRGLSSIVKQRHESDETQDRRLRKEAVREEKRRKMTLGVENEYTGQVPLMRPSFHENMIRERVDIRGNIRPLEAEEELQALRMDPAEIGVIKEGPCMRYLEGQSMWDKKFAREAQRVSKRRAKNEEKANVMLRRAAELELLGDEYLSEQQEGGDGGGGGGGGGGVGSSSRKLVGSFDPLDLEGETPPPSAIAGRRDTEESLALLRTSLRRRAGLDDSLHPRRHLRARKHDASFLREKKRKGGLGGGGGGGGGGDDGSSEPGAAERQVEGGARYGLGAWNTAMTFFTHRERSKARAERMRGVKKGKGHGKGKGKGGGVESGGEGSGR